MRQDLNIFGLQLVYEEDKAIQGCVLIVLLFTQLLKGSLVGHLLVLFILGMLVL